MGQARHEPNLISTTSHDNVGSDAFGRVLQTTLDVYDLLKRFHQTLQQTVCYHSFHFQHTQTNHCLTIGSCEAHRIHFQLALNDQSLGEIEFTKSNPFSQDEQEYIEQALKQLLYPLRNAISYHAVVIHSVTCSLTQLGNRSLFDQTICREMDLASRHKGTFSLLLLDIDDFKKINDSLGHLGGDTVLQEMGKILKGLKRQSDYVFRYGGEEFVFILSQSTLAGATLVAERVRQQIAHHTFQFEDKPISVTVSMGLTQFQNGEPFATLFQRVDKALYQAKEEGKNRIIAL